MVCANEAQPKFVEARQATAFVHVGSRISHAHTRVHTHERKRRLNTDTRTQSKPVAHAIRHALMRTSAPDFPLTPANDSGISLGSSKRHFDMLSSAGAVRSGGCRSAAMSARPASNSWLKKSSLGSLIFKQNIGCRLNVLVRKACRGE